MANSDGVKFYLDYLDKEMTIMGILSGFCVAVLALVVDKIALAKDSPSLASLWSRQENHWLIGLTALLLAALLFYLQRSYLAFYYGQIALAQARGAKSYYSVDDWLRDADSWETWLSYKEGFVSLSFGFFQFSIALIQHRIGPLFPSVMTLFVLLPALVVFSSLRRYVLTRYRFHDEPWKDWGRRSSSDKD